MKIGPLTISRYAEEQSAPKPETQPQRREVGATGTTFFSGFLTGEEYNTDLQGDRGIKIYDRMAKSDGTARAIERAVTLPILSAVWSVEAASDDPADVEIAEFVESCIFGMTMNWQKTLFHILRMLRYGFYPFEPVWEVRDGKYAWRKWAPRKPSTRYRWYFDENGGVAGLQQRTWKVTPASAGVGVPAAGEFKFIDLPIDRLLLFVNEGEGSNYEGESLFRPMYKHWYMKENCERIMAIGVERREIGVEFAKMAENATEADTEAVAKALMNLHAHEKGYVVFPSTVAEQGLLGVGTRAASPSLQFIEYCKREMAVSALAEFLAMGSDANGTQAMHRDKTSLFMLADKAIAMNIADTINDYAIKRLVDVNFAGVVDYPKLTFSKLDTRNMQEYAHSILELVQANMLTPDRVTQEAIRNDLDLPEMPEDEGLPLPQPAENELPPDDPGGEKLRRRLHRGYSTAFQRELTVAEQRCDLAALEDALNNGAAALVESAQEVQAGQIRELLKVAEKLVGNGDAKRVERVEIPYSTQMADAVGVVLEQLYDIGAKAAKQEIGRAGYAIAAERTSALGYLAARAKAVAGVLSAKLRSAFVWETLRQLAVGTFDKSALADKLQLLSTRDLEAAARASVSEALNLGRQSEFEQHDDEIAYMEYSAILDANTCEACSERDGAQYELGSAEYEQNLPPLYACYGEGRCRCIMVAVFKDEVGKAA